MLSRIEREFEASDQRRFIVPCPHCGAMQWPKFDRLRWRRAARRRRISCEGCDPPSRSTLTSMLEGGERRATATATDPTTVGYHLSALHAAVSKLMRDRIVRVARKAEVVTAFRNTIGRQGTLATRLQPNHPADDPRGIAVSVLDGLLHGAGDAKDRIEVETGDGQRAGKLAGAVVLEPVQAADAVYCSEGGRKRAARARRRCS
ncbi:ethanolamine ammonia-lyase subunit EutB [Paracoccus mutanolyticus]|uniref:ethanolamine ammonia-lyase subunit EutB n=1 Tax=Paracoccus mutanolyticus TaxID=1499308 RepID=UPI0021D52A05|nr:ethanolamine ammonia-lyase subunit EutB [Paracoccus mutanolyticus]